MPDRILSVLFVCADNAVTSILAESILRSVSGGRFRAFSAGRRAARSVNPSVLEFLRLRHLPIDGLRTRSWDEFAQPLAPKLDYVIIVSDAVASQAFPDWPNQPVVAHWSVEDLTETVRPLKDSNAAIRDVFWVLNRRIKIFASLPFGTTKRPSLRHRVQALETWQ